MVSNSPKSTFYQSDLDLYIDPMTLILKLDVDIVNISYHTKDKVSMLRYSKVIAQTDTQTDKTTHSQDEKHYLLTYVGSKNDPKFNRKKILI